MRAATSIRFVPLTLLIAGLLVGCGSVKETVYRGLATSGNTYCEAKDPVVRDALVDRVNSGLAAEGAKFMVLGIKCTEEE